MKVELTEPLVVEVVIELLDKYLVCCTPSGMSTDCEQPEDFLAKTLDVHTARVSSDKKEAVSLLFFTVLDYKPFLDIVSENFFQHRRRRHTDDKNTVNVMVYLVLFHLDVMTWSSIKVTLLHLHPLKAFNLLRFLTTDEALTHLALDGCKIFDMDFVKERIVTPLESPDNLLKGLRNAVRNFLATQKNSKKISPTVPVDLGVLRKVVKRKPLPELPSDLFKIHESCVPPPASTYNPPNTEQKLAKTREQNKREAQQLLALAQRKAFRCAAPKSPRRPADVEQPVREQYKANPPPDFSKVVPVKQTATTVLREGARLRRLEQTDVERLKAMIAGGANYLVYERLETELREQQQREELEALERKHLKGLLTREEAALAKQRLMQRQKERIAAFKDEREMWERRLAEYRAAEERKMRHLVGRSHRIEQAARDRQVELHRHKRESAQELTRDIKARLDQALKEKEEELNRRIELICELRALQRIRHLRTKEFDCTETQGLGLMCEMSIAELRERLMILRQDLHDELERRRARAKELRTNQRRLVADTEEFIRKERVARKVEENSARLRAEPVRPRDTEELRQLRQKLEDARLMRANQ